MKNLCTIRDICRGITEFENSFQSKYSLCLNEGMVLCCLRDGKLSSGEIAEQMSLTCSNTSKVLRSVEEKYLVERILGEVDKRQMYFCLTKKGEKILKEIEKEDIEVPDILKVLIG